MLEKILWKFKKTDTNYILYYKMNNSCIHWEVYNMNDTNYQCGLKSETHNKIMEGRSPIWKMSTNYVLNLILFVYFFYI